MEISTLTTPELFTTLASEWNPLLHHSMADTPFLTLEWQRTWWACLCQGELRVITVRDSGTLLGIAPLFLVSIPGVAESAPPCRSLR